MKKKVGIYGEYMSLSMLINRARNTFRNVFLFYIRHCICLNQVLEATDDA